MNHQHRNGAVRGWVELSFWIALALMPILQWANGPSVSTDQAVVRTALVGIAVSGGVALRIVNWRRGAKSRVSGGATGRTKGEG